MKAQKEPGEQVGKVRAASSGHAAAARVARVKRSVRQTGERTSPGPDHAGAGAPPRDLPELEGGSGRNETDDRLALAIEGSGVALFDVDVTTRTVCLSEAWAAMMGEAPGPAVEPFDRLLARVPAEDQEILKARYLDAIKGRSQRYEAVHRVRARDGEWKWIHSLAKVVARAADGRALRLSGVNVDITERKRAEALNAELATIVRCVDAAIVSCAPDMTIVAWNPAAERLFGFGADEAIGQPITLIVPPGGRAHCLQKARNAVNGETGAADVCKFVTKAGLLLDISFSVSPIRGADGTVTGIAAVLHDVSPTLQAQAALRASELRFRELNAELERRVVERTRRLEAANRELEAFSYSVSHDLRAPLRAMDGFSEFLLQKYGDRLDERGRDYLGRIRRASLRMNELIDDLLHLSRVSASRVRSERVDMSALARSCLAELEQRSPARRVTAEVQDGIAVQGDARLLRIALENLLGNAWKFTALREHAHIRFEARNEGGEQVLSVADDGTGFDMAYAHKLFTPFQRLHDAKAFEGSGIGLATVQRIVNLHGGRIWAAARAGGGATFHFVIPAGGAAGATEGPAPAPRERSG